YREVEVDPNIEGPYRQRATCAVGMPKPIVLPTYGALPLDGAVATDPPMAARRGESGLMSTASAIANAIAQAIGVRLTVLPLTPEHVWQAMRVTPAHQTSSAKESLPSP